MVSKIITTFLSVVGVVTMTTGCFLTAAPLSVVTETNAPPETTWVEVAKQTLVDFGQLPGSKCYGSKTATLPAAAETCTTLPPGGAVAKGTAVLIGDSHASQWYPAVTQAMTTAGYHVRPLTKVACPVGKQLVWQASTRSPYTSCKQWNKNVLRIVRDTKPAVVIVSQRSNYYSTLHGNTKLTPERSANEQATKLAEQLRKYRTAGAKVVFIRDTPIPATGNVPNCVKKHHTADACAFPTKEGEPFDSAVKKELRRIGVPIVDVTNHICGNVTCQVNNGWVLKWRDDDHLSKSYVTGPLFAAFSEELTVKLFG